HCGADRGPSVARTAIRLAAWRRCHHHRWMRFGARTLSTPQATCSLHAGNLKPAGLQRFLCVKTFTCNAAKHVIFTPPIPFVNWPKGRVCISPVALEILRDHHDGSLCGGKGPAR